MYSLTKFALPHACFCMLYIYVPGIIVQHPSNLLHFLILNKRKLKRPYNSKAYWEF